MRVATAADSRGSAIQEVVDRRQDRVERRIAAWIIRLFASRRRSSSSRSWSSQRWRASTCTRPTSPSTTSSTSSASTSGWIRRAITETHAQPLALRLARAFESGGSQQRARLRGIGDFSLFMSGFFPDSFARRAVGRRLLQVDGGVRLRIAEPLPTTKRSPTSSANSHGSSSDSPTCSPTSANGRRSRRRPTSCGSTRSGCAPAASGTDSASSNAGSCRISRSASASSSRRSADSNVPSLRRRCPALAHP